MEGGNSVGRRETFYGELAPILVETYLLDFVGDLYGETLRVELLSHLRGQSNFTTVESLVEAIALDATATRDLVRLARR